MEFVINIFFVSFSSIHFFFHFVNVLHCYDQDFSSQFRADALCMLGCIGRVRFLEIYINEIHLTSHRTRHEECQLIKNTKMYNDYYFWQENPNACRKELTNVSGELRIPADNWATTVSAMSSLPVRDCATLCLVVSTHLNDVGNVTYIC